MEIRPDRQDYNQQKQPLKVDVPEAEATIMDIVDITGDDKHGGPFGHGGGGHHGGDDHVHHDPPPPGPWFPPHDPFGPAHDPWAPHHPPWDHHGEPGGPDGSHGGHHHR